MKVTEPGNEPLFPPKATWKCPISDDPRYGEPTKPENHRDWHHSSIYNFTEDTKLLEGMFQLSYLKLV